MIKYPKVSVVVPVFNRQKVIGECIESLLSLDYPSYEIIVVDNGSTDKTCEIASRYPVTLIVEKEGGAYPARNAGVQSADGEIIAFTDSDCTADKSWLKHLVINYTHERIGGVGGHLLPLKPSTVVEKFLSFGPLRIFHSPQTAVMQRKNNRFLSGALGSANMSYRKRVLEEVKGFCGNFSVFCGAYDLCWRVQRAGYEIIYDPEAVVRHRLRSTVRELIKQMFLFGECQPQLLKKQPEGLSYIKIKTYLFPSFGFTCKLPFSLLVTFDFCNLFAIALLLMLVNPSVGYVALGILVAISGGTMRRLLPIVRKTREVRWFLLYPLLHLIQSYALMAGRIWGGLKYRVISI